MSDTQQSPSGANAQPGVGAQAPPSEDELRAAYEAELNRITSAEMVIQTAVSLLNIGGRRLGLAPGSEGERDLEQVRDAIDGVRALMPILERRMPAELRPLRDALAQLQMAYAREAASSPQPAASASQTQSANSPQPDASQEPGAKPAGQPSGGDAPSKGPGPAESSGRLWVPGR